MVWDIFISHASEDKDAVARPLADTLIQHGLNVWYDEYTLTLGDSLRRSIDKGLAGSRYGLVILSPHFFEKEWTQKELDGLVAREDGSEKRILPVWHNVNRKDVVSFSPPLADKLGVSTTKGLDHVVREIIRVLKPATLTKPATEATKGKRPGPKKKAGLSSSVAKRRPVATWVMLDRFFFQASGVQQTHDGEFFIEVVPSSTEEEADLQSLCPSRHGGSSSVPFAVRNDAHLVHVKKCEKELAGRSAKWKLTLAPDDRNFGSGGIEATINEGGKSHTPEEIARLRAGRLLLNDPPLQEHDRRSFHHSLVESAITGSGKYPVRASVIRSIFDSFGKRSHWRELARLQAVFLLKATGTVESILDLTIGPVRAGQVAVTFRGRRRSPYTGKEPIPVEVSGECKLK
ncbi:MAG: toll/interleukin-1 receptor domain-containing protein [Planctomycetes bacterium]|nr:toll/interleukin-1 receptor domain-containing protein [Planctomycetota bacterium]